MGDISLDAKIGVRARRSCLKLGPLAKVLMAAAMIIAAISERVRAESSGANAITIAVFGFELQDNSPAGTLGKLTTGDKSLQLTTTAAREQLASSGRYDIVRIDGVAAKSTDGRSLRDCDGCEAEIARKAGAQQSMIGIVRRVTQTDYYIVVVIRDTNTGKILNAQVANFAGGEEGWASGVRKLIKHQVLAQ